MKTAKEKTTSKNEMKHEIIKVLDTPKTLTAENLKEVYEKDILPLMSIQADKRNEYLNVTAIIDGSMYCIVKQLESILIFNKGMDRKDVNIKALVKGIKYKDNIGKEYNTRDFFTVYGKPDYRSIKNHLDFGRFADMQKKLNTSLGLVDLQPLNGIANSLKLSDPEIEKVIKQVSDVKKAGKYTQDELKEQVKEIAYNVALKNSQSAVKAISGKKTVSPDLEAEKTDNMKRIEKVEKLTAEKVEKRPPTKRELLLSFVRRNNIPLKTIIDLIGIKYTITKNDTAAFTSIMAGTRPITKK